MKIKSYTINKGCNYSEGLIFRAIKNLFSPIFNIKELYFGAKFHHNALYELKNINEKGDINKLYGFAYYGLNHLNSFRIGWTGEGGKIKIYLYYYINGKRYFQLLGECKTDEWIYFNIRFENGKIKVRMTRESGNTFLAYTEKYTTTGVFVLKQFPYFGGNAKAPHKIRIDIKEIKWKKILKK